MMYPLIFCSVLLLALIVERAVTLRKASTDPEGLLEDVQGAFTPGGDPTNAISLAQGNGIIGKVFARGLKNSNRTADAMEMAMELEAANELPTLEANLPIIKTIVNIGPLLGLLGTIAGMITSFQERQNGLEQSDPGAWRYLGSPCLDRHRYHARRGRIHRLQLLRKPRPQDNRGHRVLRRRARQLYDRTNRMRRRVKVGRRKAAEEPEIVVIPMIDVMMFLLFFFMVASLAMAVQNGLPVALPKASTGKDQRSQTVTVTLLPDGSVYLNMGKTTIDKLGDGLKAIGVGKTTLVTLNSDERVPYGSVVAVMDEARKAGVQNFGFATNRK